jgi:glycosyltransferase involved in cell wall biosynthesis
MTRTACFYAHVDDQDVVQRVQFYRRDIDSLEKMGFQVIIARRWRDIPWNMDLYFVWWWTWAFQPLLKARLRNRPVVITGVYGFQWGPQAYVRRPRWQRALLSSSVRRSSVNVLLSELELEDMSREYPNAKVSYVPCSVDTSAYRPGTKERDPNLVFTIAWLEKFNAERKCLREIVDAIPIVVTQNPAIRFVIAGVKGQAYEQLFDRATRSGINDSIEWTGPISEERKISLLQSCGVYLQPSRFEGFGLAILEAMSCGATIVTSRVGAVPEVVGDAAIFCDGEDPQSIADAILSVQAGRYSSGRLGLQARARAVARFSTERRSASLSRIVEGLVVGG